MSQSMTARKMNIEKTQIRSILNDYRKAKQKCINLMTEIGEQFRNIDRFNSVEKETMLKIELLGLNELVQMKNTLVTTLSELFDLENQLNTKKEREEARKNFRNLGSSTKMIMEVGSPRSRQNLSMKQINHKLKAQEAFDETSKNRAKNNNFNVPVYRMKEDTSENKIERISKYVASLKSTIDDKLGNMKQHCVDMGVKKIKDILLDEPQFVRIKEELERYRMRDEELQIRLARSVKKAIEEHLKDADIIEQTKQYRIVKIRKEAHPITDTSGSSSFNSENLNIESRLSKREDEKRSEKLKKKEEVDSDEEEKEIMEMQLKLQKKESALKEASEKMSKTFEVSESKLKEMREERKKIFLDDDIWKELDQF